MRFTITFYINFGQIDARDEVIYHDAATAIEASAWAREEAGRRFKDVVSVPALRWRVWV